MFSTALTGAIIAISFAAPPGPVAMETIRRGLRGGFYPALKVQLGSIIGDMTWCAVALLGLAPLVQVTWIRLGLAVVGVAVLISLGAMSIRDAFRASHAATTETASPKNGAFKSGLAISMANPMAVGYWIGIGGALIATGVAGSTAAETASFIGGFLVATFLWAFLMAIVVRWGKQIVTPLAFRVVTFTCGVALLIFGFTLASEILDFRSASQNFGSLEKGKENFQMTLEATKETSAVKLTTPKEVIAFARKEGLKIVDYKFVDLPGTWQHFSAMISELDESTFSEGVGFDGSSIRGFQAIHESDMLLIPDPTTAIIDPVCEVPTLSIACNVVDPLTREPYSRDPRYIAQKAEAYLTKSGIADTSYWGPEAEFFIFDNIRFDQNQYSAMYAINSEEGIWNSGANGGAPNLGHRPRWKEGYFPVAPADTLQDLRSEIVLRLQEAGIAVEVHHHEVATAGQCEIDLRFDTLVTMADNMLLYKYIIKNIARAHGKTATFMPKPIWGDNGSGMHVHQSLWKGGKTLMHDKDGYAGLSQLSKYYIGGLLKHAPALLALVAPTVNSYHRLVPGFEAPVNLVYSRRNRSAAVRIPMYTENPKAKRIEFRCPDPACNPYLAFAALLMAGLDGIENKIDPGEPSDYDLFEHSHNGHGPVKQVPGSLPEALAALDKDHAFLLKGDVFTKDVLETWVEMKRTKEIDPMRLRPHPYEFHLYYDV